MTPYKLILLGSTESIHLQRWANSLSDSGVNVHLVSMSDAYTGMSDSINFYKLPFSGPFGYILNSFALNKIFQLIKPDLINVHYATGYGLMARLARVFPVLLSVWGSDIYEFPNKSLLHYWLLRGNLKYANAIASTSECMARRVKGISGDSFVYITPFGIDINKFHASPKPSEIGNYIVVGTVKTLAEKYGIDTLICAFALTWKALSCPSNLILEITGGGTDRDTLEVLAADLGIAAQIRFHGEIAHCRVPEMLNRLDIYVALSRSESFGVAILEAGACEKPVLVSDAEGLVEVVKDGETGLVVPSDNPAAASAALLQLINDADMRFQMGKAARKHVLENYSWCSSLDAMIKAQSQSIELWKSCI